MSDITELAMKYRKALIRNDEQTIKRLIETYQGIYTRIQPNIDLFVTKIQLMLAEGAEVSTYQIRRMEAYQQLLSQVKSELTKYSNAVVYEGNLLEQSAIKQGLLDSRNLVRLAAEDGIVRGSFRTLTPAVIETLAGYLDEAGPLYKRISMYGEATAKAMSETILDGVAMGKNPKTIARELTNKLGVSLTDSMRTAKTVQMHAYRDAAIANYKANDDVVKGWIWLSARDSDTCMGCLAEDNGEIRSNDEVMDDHYNGHCTPVPVVYGASRPVEGSGKEWFDSQSEATQRGMMGPEKYEAYQDGKFEFSDLSTTHTDEVYGDMIGETSLKDLLADQPEGIDDTSINLSEEERQSIHEWGISGRNMRNVQSGDTDGMTEQEIRKAERSLNNFNSALEKLPEYKGEIVRGLHDIPDSVIDSWSKDAIIELNNHQSATSLTDVGNEFSGMKGFPDRQSVVWIADQENGKDLMGLTNVTYGGKTVNEAEILMTEGSRYEIVNKEFWVKDTLWDNAKLDWYFEGTEFSHSNMPEGFRLDNEFSGFYKIFLKEVK